MESDRWNDERLRNKENIQQWFPAMPEMSFLWLAFIGKGNWFKGFWVHHPKTSYLDFELVMEGELTVHFNGQRHLVPAGAAVLIPPGESKLSTRSPQGCRKHFLGISGLILNNNLAEMNLDKVCVLKNFRNSEFDTLFASLWAMTEEKNPNSVREYSASIYQMLLLFSHCAVQQPYPKELQLAISFICQHFSKKMGLTEICNAAYCGRSTLQWQFKHCLGSSPIHQLTEVRLRFALKLLENTSLSIKEIAQKCGYGDQLYFSSSFRKFYGCSPREYRKKGNLR